MDVILFLEEWQFALLYLNDIAVYFCSPRDKTNHVNQALVFLHDAEVPLKVEISSLFTGTTDCLGHVLRPRRLEIAIHTTDCDTQHNPDRLTTQHSETLLQLSDLH